VCSFAPADVTRDRPQHLGQTRSGWHSIKGMLPSAHSMLPVHSADVIVQSSACIVRIVRMRLPTTELPPDRY